MLNVAGATIAEPFSCLMVRKSDAGEIAARVEQIALSDWPAGEVVIEVAYSSINYKDALACQGHPGIVGKLPHVPGIDCAGTVVESSVPQYAVGQQVLVTGYDLGSPGWGGYSALVRVPAEWVVPLPDSLALRDTMIYGTAGFTAAQCVQAILHHGVTPEKGEIVVTGATGGVGCVAIALLAKLGFTTVAVSGKPERADALRQLGATRVIGREEVDDRTDRPLLKSLWAGAVDTVGGNTLVTLLRSLKHRGCVAACGLVAGAGLPLTTYPFLLRGAALLGIDSAKCPREPREDVWHQLAGAWKIVDKIEPWVREVSLEQVPAEVAKMLAGQNFGRILVRPR
jgi:acrylyl-CoA reductase (NADPH)